MRIRWADPPPRYPDKVAGTKKKREHRFTYIFHACRNNPGRWAQIPGTFSSGYGHNLVTRTPYLRDPGFEVVQRRAKTDRSGGNNHRYWVFVRWHAPETTPAETPPVVEAANGSAPATPAPQVPVTTA